MSDFCHQLDESHQRTVTQRSKEIARSRTEGLPSDRLKPVRFAKCPWVFRQTQKSLSHEKSLAQAQSSKH